jgi:Protein of unknown function (DUF3040)
MSLSRREEEALATLEKALRADDPTLAAVLDAPPSSLCSSLISVRHVVHLFAALLVLVLVTALFGARLGVLGTAAVTGVLVLPWLVLTVRSAARGARRAARRPSRRTGRRTPRAVSPLGVGLGQVAIGVGVLVVALASLPPIGQALVGLLAAFVVVPWLALRIMGWLERGTSR